MKFTKNEIDLCKQIAEKQRKRIEKGDMYFYQDEIHLWSMPFKQTKDVMTTNEVIPLWTLSDCLEFLNQANSFKTQLYNTKWNWYCKTKRYEIGAKEYFARGKTPLEACLKAVLAVLEEGNSGK